MKKTILSLSFTLLFTLANAVKAEQIQNIGVSTSVMIICDSKILARKTLSNGSLQVDISELCNTPNHSLKLSYKGGNTATSINVNKRVLRLSDEGDVVIAKRSTPHRGTNVLVIQNPGPSFEIEAITMQPH